MTPSPSKVQTSFIDGPYVQCLCECVEPYFAYCREGVNRSPHAHDLDMPWRPTSWLATLLRNDVSTKIPTSQTWFARNIFTAKEDSSLNIWNLYFFAVSVRKNQSDWRLTSWLATLLRNDVSTKIPTSQTWFAWNIFTAKEDSNYLFCSVSEGQHHGWQH